MVDQVLGLLFEEQGTGMDLDVLLGLQGAVGARFLQFSAMMEVTGGDTLLDIGALVVGVDRELLVIGGYLDSLHQSLELLLDIPGSAEGSNLDVVVGAPL